VTRQPAVTPQPGEEASRPTDAQHAERRLLNAVFQQAPVPMLLLGLDGMIWRVNAAAAGLLGSGSGYPTGRAFTTFVDLAHRTAVRKQLAATVETGETANITATLLTASGGAEHVLDIQAVAVRGDAGQLLVTVREVSAVLGQLVTVQAAEAGHPGGQGQSGGPGRAGESGGPAGPDRVAVAESMTRRLDLVIAASRILLENISYSESVTLQQFARLLAREFSSWVIIDLEHRQRLRRRLVTAGRDRQADELARIVSAVDPQPATAPHEVHESGSSLVMANAEDVGALGTGPDGVPLLMTLGVTSVLCVPLSHGERRYGTLTLARSPASGHFGMSDVGLVEELAEQLAVAIRLDRLFRQHTDIAEALHASLLPRTVRQIPSVQVAAVHVAATTGDVGGDFYDVYPTRSGWGIAIGDVCGKGEDAPAVTAAARHAIRALAHCDPDPAAVLRAANDVMLAEEFGGRFVTANVCQLAWQRSALRVVSASAGHPAPILISPDGRTQSLRGGGLPLGIFEDSQPATQQLSLEAGDALFFLTDGLISACGPDMVTFEDRLSDELAALAGRPAADMVSQMRDVVLSFCRDDVRDNLTMLAIRAGEPPGG
jgi:serine phosphatase RsbU (regulator of sigma subunit)